MDQIYTKIYPPPIVDEREILRYAGVRRGDASDELSALLSSCIAECEGKLTYKVCYRRLPLDVCGNKISLGELVFFSDSLSKVLGGCEQVIIFGATVGLGLDRLITRYSAISPTRALMLQAYGGERIEALCDAFFEDMKKELSEEGFSIVQRFSPGYGDLTLETQRDIFSALECYKKIGLTLNESFVMSPSKSVTAIIGIYKTDC